MPSKANQKNSGRKFSKPVKQKDSESGYSKGRGMKDKGKVQSYNCAEYEHYKYECLTLPLNLIKRHDKASNPLQNQK